MTLDMANSLKYLNSTSGNSKIHFVCQAGLNILNTG